MAEYQNPRDKVKELTDKLEQGLQDLFNSERYTEYLTVMSKFYRYSANNNLLIAMQRPDATHVAGYGDWQKKFNRHVKRGEHGIKILAPCPINKTVEMEKTDPATGKPQIGPDGKPVMVRQETTIPAFRVVTVFDVSQTDGEPLATLGVNELTGDVERYDAFMEALKRVSPVPIAFEDIRGSAKGYYHLEDKRIAIQQGMSEIQTVKTAIHEITHAMLHTIGKDDSKGKDKNTREVEAESVAFTVCQRFGLDTSDYSFAYVAGWSSDRNTKELKASMETIRKTAGELITSIEGQFQELLKEQERAAPEQPEAPIPEAKQEPGTFEIYQIKDGPEHHYRRFTSLATLQAEGDKVDAANYDRVYTAPLEPGLTLEGIFRRFNIERPEDFTGHSLSVSDVVVLRRNGKDTAHYVDSFGFADVPEFVEQLNHLQTAEMTVEQNMNMLDGQINNLPPEPPKPGLDPAVQPIVTILRSESEHLKKGEKLTLAEADALFKRLDAEHGPMGYDKTAFRIDYLLHGESASYEGRQDFGDGEGSLINHIRKYQEYYADDAQWKAFVTSRDGAEAAEQEAAARGAFLQEVIPYFELHCGLTRLEQAVAQQLENLRALPEPDALDQSRIVYYEAMQTYVDDCRRELNTAVGGYHLPEMPKELDSYTPELRAYRAQVEKEIQQEAAEMGISVDEYAASGFQYTPPTQEAPAPGTYDVYKIKDGPEYQSLRYLSFGELDKGKKVDAANYEQKETGTLEPGLTQRDEVFKWFDKEHLLSDSDVVVLHLDGKDAAFYVDEMGCAEISQFVEQLGHTPEQPEIASAPESGLPEILSPYLDKEGPFILDPNKEPVVTITWSENGRIPESGLSMPLHVADAFIRDLDGERRGHSDKTDFTITFKLAGELDTYNGSLELGAGQGLIEHIRDYAEYCLYNEGWQNYLQSQGPEAQAEENASLQYVADTIVPYLETHNRLSALETQAREHVDALRENPALDILHDGGIPARDATAEYVEAARQELNTITDPDQCVELAYLKQAEDEKSMADFAREEMQKEQPAQPEPAPQESTAPVTDTITAKFERGEITSLFDLMEKGGKPSVKEQIKAAKREQKPPAKTAHKSKEMEL